MNQNKPIIGISMGDPASIGPEVTVKAVTLAEVTDKCRPIVFGDLGVLENALKITGLDLKLNPISDVSEAIFDEAGMVNVFDMKNVDLEKLQLGEVSAMAGNAAFENVTKMISLALEGTIDATVTGPIHKESINKAGHKYSGHTEIYADYTNTSKYAMLLVEENLRVIHVSTHVSLRQACDLVKKQRVLDTIELLHDACKQIGIENPKLGVPGLNPHSSDGGLFGDEEEKEIIPAIKEAQEKGYDVEGPVPPDTLFPKAIGGVYDGCVAMYHDQGHIPFKVHGFNWDKKKKQMKSVRGVNITLGLPIIRTSVDHGTAMEIAGKNIASPDAMVLAIEYAVRLHQSKKK
ncbi:4-hydroxythreonine-4-phosphate dehydrogenase PdxA [Gramella jeungdoensis]|uniref:4-hydroxythreonine-4-phosphate dehydrogenase PdxA n=1 Tax=Gramella jeungdoensis TaxID=708091 RepID=A0ABT0YZY9_9FLAO|nr:4-hydroxythreonine-4-phosphate dehydrogenase PdxA [Gramella jeungdoensis]MCM8568467.1 4-hydroxythreonine-4-phosphate dehydrogenase PdxA [Gramella jeungdoensis]